MATVRVVQAIMGYFIPFALLVTALFFLEFGVELITGFIAVTVNRLWNTNFDTTPDFPGPLNLLNFAIGSFPSIWDIGTTLFWGSIEEFTFIGGVFFLLLGGITGVAFFRTISTDLQEISAIAGGKSSVKSRLDTYDKIEPYD